MTLRIRLIPRVAGPLMSASLIRSRAKSTRRRRPDGRQMTTRLHNAGARAVNDGRVRALAARLAGGLDLHQQILAANVRLQIHDGGRWAQRTRQRPFDSAEIRRLPNVNLELETVEGVARRSDHAIRLIQQGVDVGHGLARLRSHISGVNGFVADDARGAGDEQIRPRRFAQYTGARKDRAVAAAQSGFEMSSV